MPHANRRLRVTPKTQSDYAPGVPAQGRPAAAPAAGTLAAQGADLFVQGRNNSGKFPGGGACATCHTIGGGTSAGGLTRPHPPPPYSPPAVAGDTPDKNPGKLRPWLTQPPTEKPGSVLSTPG